MFLAFQDRKKKTQLLSKASSDKNNLKQIAK